MGGAREDEENHPGILDEMRLNAAAAAGGDDDPKTSRGSFLIETLPGREGSSDRCWVPGLVS